MVLRHIRSTVLIAYESPVFVITARRERPDLFANPYQVFGFGGEENGMFLIIAVIQRPDPDRVSGGDKRVFRLVMDHESKFGIQERKHGGICQQYERLRGFTT